MNASLPLEFIVNSFIFNCQHVVQKSLMTFLGLIKNRGDEDS